MIAVRALPLLAFLACAPDPVEIGVTEWETPVGTAGFAEGRTGPAGHVALRRYEEILLVAPDGQLLFRVPCGDCAMPNRTLALDQAGNLYLTLAMVEEEQIELRKLAAGDGGEVWSLRLPGDRLSPGVLIDGAGNLWAIVNAAGPTDLGGGPVGGAETEARWARFDPDGRHLASGALGFVAGACSAAWPDRAGVVLTRSGCVGAIAIDAGGAVAGIEERDDRGLVATHADGEITVQSYSDAPSELLRLDAEGRERWRVELGAFGLNAATAVTGGSLMVSQYDGLGASSDVSYLQEIDAGGDVSEREYFTATASLVAGAPLDGYAFVSDGQLVRRRLP